MTLVCVAQHGRHATLFDAIDQLFAVDPHEVHRHRASDECAAAIEDRPHHCLDRRHAVLLHEVQDHGGAHTHHVHLAQDEVCSATRHHHAKHPFDERLLDAHVLVFAQDIQAPDCLLYTSDAADDLLCVDLGGRRIIKKKKKIPTKK